MNSSQNQPFAQVLENSEATIKPDLRALRRERMVRLEDAGAWDGDPFEQLRKAMEPMASEAVEDLKRLSRPVFVGANVSIGYVTEEPQPVVAFDWPLEGSQSVTATYQLVGLTNHPKSQRAAAGGGRRAMLNLGLALAACGRSLNDVIVIGGGQGQPRRLSQIDYTVFDDCAPPVDPLSAHPGERHRQLSRNLTSSRSRAGKAARWSS